MAAELIEQFWGKVVHDKMYRKSANGKRVLYSERMFEVLTTFFNTVKGDDTNWSWRTIIEDWDTEVKWLTNDERDDEESEDKETLATIVEDIQENDQEDNNTNEENQTVITDTSIESMNIPVLQNNLLRAKNDHL